MTSRLSAFPASRCFVDHGAGVGAVDQRQRAGDPHDEDQHRDHYLDEREATLVAQTCETGHLVGLIGLREALLDRTGVQGDKKAGGGPLGPPPGNFVRL